MCQSCKGSGYVVATERETKYIYAFSCPCGGGRQGAKNLPQWKNELRLKYDADHLKLVNQPTTKPVTPPKPTEIKKEHKIAASDPHAYDDTDDLPF